MIQAAGSNYESGLLYLESGCLSLAEAKLPPALSELQSALDQFQQWQPDSRDRLEPRLAGRGLGWVWGRKPQAPASSGRGGLSHPDGRDSPLVHMLRHAAPWLADLHSDPETDPLLTRIAKAEQRLPALRKRLRRMLKAVPCRPPG